MKLSAIIQEATYKQTTQGVREAAADFDKMATAQKNAADAGAVLVKQQDMAEKAVTRVGSKLQAYTNQFDPMAKALRDVERGERLVAAARGQGLTVSDQTLAALENARTKYARLSGAVNDNTKEAAINRAGWVNLSRQFQDVGVSIAGGMSPLMVLTQQGGQIADVFTSSKGGAAAALAEFGGVVGRFVLNPATLLVGTLGTIAFGAAKASSALADLGRQTEKIGVSPSAALGANVVGARAGVGNEDMTSALANANKEFEAFQRNTGSVLSTINMIDKGFLSTLDKARSLPQFVGMIGDEIRKLPPVEGLSLSRALLGEDAGRALFKSIGDLAGALEQTSAPLDEAAKYAVEVQRQVDTAAQIAHNDLLAAFQALTIPLADVKIAFYAIESAIAATIGKAGQLYNTLRSYIPDWTTKSGFMEPPTGEAAPKALPEINIGASRSRFAGYQESMKRHRAKSGKSDAEKELETYQKISKELDDQIRLTESVGDAHKLVQAEIDKQNWLLKLGTNATREHIDAVSAMADRLNAAKEAQDLTNQRQKEMAEYTDIAKSSFVDLGTSLANAFQRGEQASLTLLNILDRLKERLLDKALTAAADALFGGVIGGKSSTGLISKLFEFEGGGIMTSRGPLPLRAYAGGGVANSPQLALFGEGRTPEAYVPVPSGKIPVEMRGQQQAGAKVTINNYAGAQVQADQGPNGELIIAIRKMTEDMIKSQVPGVLANYNRRSQ